MRVLLICWIIISFNHLDLRSQSPDSKETKKLQIDAYLLGINKIKEFPDGSLIGLGIDYRLRTIVIGIDFFRIRKFVYSQFESTKYYDLDFLIGLHKTLGHVNASLCSGFYIGSRKDCDSKVYDPTNLKETGYTLIGLPIRIKFNYLIKRFSTGLISFYNINSESSQYGLAINLGYRF